MVKAIVGPNGSGKTRRLIQCMNDAVKDASGAMVCIEKSGNLKFDIDYRVRLIDAREYSESGYAFLRGMVSGLHAGNFDISHIYIDNVTKIVGDNDLDVLAEFLNWCDTFGADRGVDFTVSFVADSETLPETLRNFI